MYAKNAPYFSTKFQDFAKIARSIRSSGLKRGGPRNISSKFVDINNYTPPDKREMTKREIKEFYKFLKKMVLAEIQKEKEERDKRRYGQVV